MTFTAAVVGLGYWGPNLARNLAGSGCFELAALCERDPSRLERAGRAYPAARRHADLGSLLDASAPDLVAIATPVASHRELAIQALEAGCHVLVEKPMALDSAEAEEMRAVARAAGRHIFVDHVFLFTPAVREIRRRIQDGDLGELLYIDATRINLGLFQPDVDVIWDLGCHDVSILEFVLGREPASVRCLASSHNPSGFTDVAYVHLEYERGLAAHLHLSWLSPVKVRRMIFTGRRQSLIYDELDPAERIKLYDYGVEFDERDIEARAQMLVRYRKGSILAPALPVDEALAVEMRHIGKVLAGDEEPISPAETGVAVIRVLEAARRSALGGGGPLSPRSSSRG
jgi:predicted dehydrogenase